MLGLVAPAKIVNPVPMDAIEGLDVLELRGSPQDVEQVLNRVRQIERLSGLSDPPIVYPDAEAWKAITRWRARPAMEMSNETTGQDLDRVLQDRTDELIRVRAQLAELEARFKTREQAKDSAIAALTAGYGQLDEQVKKITGEVNTELQASADQTHQFAAQVETIKSKSIQAVDKANQEVGNFGKTADEIARENKNLTKTLRDLDKQQMDVPAGEITWVSLPNRMVWINRGRADVLRTGTKFTVCSADSSNVAKAVKKGTVEVVSIDGDHSARARILEDKPADPILAGDEVFTSLWSPASKITSP